MDLEKIKHMSKDEIRKELERISSLKKTSGKQSAKVKEKKEKKRPDYNIFEKPIKPKAEDFFSKEFLNELNDYMHDKKAKKTLIKIIKNKNESDSSSSDED